MPIIMLKIENSILFRDAIMNFLTIILLGVATRALQFCEVVVGIHWRSVLELELIGVMFNLSVGSGGRQRLHWIHLPVESMRCAVASMCQWLCWCQYYC